MPPPTRTPDPAYAEQAPPVIVKRAQVNQGAGEAPAPAPPANAEPAAPPPPTAVPTPVATRCVTIDSQYGVNIRGGPGVTFAQLGFAEDKTQFPFVEENPGGTWYRIRMIDGTGDETWVSADFSQLGNCDN